MSNEYRNKVIQGNNLEVLKQIPDNTFDSVVTDPPYGLGKEPNAIEVLQSWVTVGYHEVKGKGFMGKAWDAFVPQPIFWKEIYRVLKPGGYLLSFAGTRTYDWMVMAVRLAGFEIRDMIAWVYGSGFPKSMDISKALDKHSTEQAKQWQGWGTALKPALEPIVMARKPLDGTVAQNVLKHGVGGINIDGCRVGDEIIGGGTMPDLRDVGKKSKEAIGIDKLSFGQVKNAKRKEYKTHQGRFPANFIHDGSDEVENFFPETESSSGSFKASDYKQGEGVTPFTRGDFEGYGDSGSASRFFYVAKASQEERNFGLYDFEEKRHADRNKDDGVGGDNPRNRSNKPKKNFHPTVKPVELMRYLVRMVTPPNGICLDPYLGSGTTAIACKIEKFNYIGIELDEQYVEIAKARVEAVKDYETSLDTKTIIKESIEEDKEKELGIQNIFDFMEE